MWSIWRPSRRARPCLPGARPTMPAGARPAGGPNPKRPAARRRRSADGASRAAPGRPPQDRARPAHAHGLASTATLCGGIGTVGALWILLALLGFLPTVGGTNPVRFESHSILGMRILSRSDFPTSGEYLAYQRDTYTRVTGRDLDLQLEGRTTSTSLFKTMQETLDLARTNLASGVTVDALKLKEDLHGWNNLNEVYRAAKYESIYGTALEDDVGRAYDAGLERAIQNGTEVKPRSKYREEHLRNMRKKIVADRKKKQAEAKQQEEQQRARPGRRAQEVMNGTLPVEPSDVGRNARAHTNTLAPFLGDFTILRF